MANHGMLVCSFFLKKRFGQETADSIYALNENFEVNKSGIDGPITFVDSFELFKNFCFINNDISDDEQKQKIFSIEENSMQETDTATYHTLSFIIKSGNYGVEADMTDRKTKKVIHHRSADEAAVMKFHCVIFIPKDSADKIIKKGILIFETVGIYGAKMVTSQYMRQFFSEYGMTFETRSVSVKVFLEKLIEQGNLHRVTLITDKVSPNDADNMLLSSGKEEKSYLHPKLKPEFLQRMISWFDTADQTGICEIPDNEHFDDIAVTFKINKHPRTVRLRNIEKMSIVEDVPQDIFNHGNWEKQLLKYMITTADEYKSKMIFYFKDGD